MKRAVTVTLPAPHDAEIKCPICEGNRCKVCNMTGKITFTLSPKIPIQRAHIIKYIHENLNEVAFELTRMFGLIPDIDVKDVLKIGDGQYEIVQVSSIGGACWIVNRLDSLEAPKYFRTWKELENFKEERV
jgi:hypothetical protein